MYLFESKTKENLMKAFIGECQARARYELGAKVARKEGYIEVEKAFLFIASQEQQHSKIFYRFLKEFSGKNITVNNLSFPVDLYDTTLEFLDASRSNELEEYDIIYKKYAEIANNEGFNKISEVFNNIAEIEKIHADKFLRFYNEIKEGTLFKKNNEVEWFCTNCGNVHRGYEAPDVCPVCAHPKGYYTLFEKFI